MFCQKNILFYISSLLCYWNEDLSFSHITGLYRIWEMEEIWWNYKFQWIHNLIFWYVKYAVHFSRATQKLEKVSGVWDNALHYIHKIRLFYFLKGTSDLLFDRQEIIRCLWISVKLYVKKPFGLCVSSDTEQLLTSAQLSYNTGNLRKKYISEPLENSSLWWLVS